MVQGAERSEFSISELAREFDVTPRAIRLHEAQGLPARRREGQHRIYTAPGTLTVARAEVYAREGKQVATMQQTLMMLAGTPDSPEQTPA